MTIRWESLSYAPESGKVFCGTREVGSKNRNGYLGVSIEGERYWAHRLAWFLHYGDWPKGHIDHINGDKLDNRVSNLRDVSPADNMRNKRKYKSNPGGITGVRFDPVRGTYRAYISSKGKQTRLGRHKCFGKAVRARKLAEKTAGFSARHGL